MLKLKEMINNYMRKMALLIVAVILVIAVVVQMLNEQRRARENADNIFYQLEQILEENQKDLSEVELEYSRTCLNNAEMIAYIIENKPEILDDVDEFKKIAKQLEIDEIHIFDETGRIFTGTHSEYYGLTMNSGEQIAYFKPLLQDKSLRLCQDITPNTAEGKMMQYSALWSGNGEFIVQVGMEPVNVMKVTAKNELSYIFSLLKVDIGADFYAVDAKTGEIVGSTNTSDVGKQAGDIGLNLEEMKIDADGFHEKVKGSNSFCVFKLSENTLIGRVVSNDALYQRVPGNTAALAACLIIIAYILVYILTRYIDRHIIRGIYDINKKLREITEGNLDENVDVENSKEFFELSSHINEMIKSLLSGTEKISYVLNKTNLRIGVYEYNEHMKNVRYTESIPELMGFDDGEGDNMSADYNIFKYYWDKLRTNPLPNEENVFLVQGDSEVYVKIEEITHSNDILGVIVDVTAEINKRRQIESERDMDLLTGLYNRRGMESQLTRLFANPDKLYYGALIMIDADGLKGINDRYGHAKGDIYIKKVADVINNFGIRSSLAARQGGDEFVLFLYGYDGEDELINTIKTLEYIRDHATAHLADDLIVPLRFSLGVCMTKGEKDYHSLLKQADEKMYENKRERKKAAADV